MSLLDEDGEIRATLVASSATDPDGTAFLFFRGKDRPVTEMASLIGSLRDGTGTVVVRRDSGESIEIS